MRQYILYSSMNKNSTHIGIIHKKCKQLSVNVVQLNTKKRLDHCLFGAELHASDIGVGSDADGSQSGSHELT